MKILITGAGGGIGSTLSFELRRLGHEVFPLDNFRNGYHENLVRGAEKFDNVIEADVRDPDLISKIPKGLDSIIHLAAITSLPECETLPLECMSINIQGSTNILELARITGCEQVIFSSTSAVYENNKQEVFTEDLQTEPHLWYSLSKKIAEDICLSYMKKYGLKITIARLFNVFGPDQDIYRPNPPLINYIVREINANRVPLLHGTGNQSRDYISVADVVNFFVLALERKTTGIFNACSGELRSVNNIFSIVSAALESNLTPKFQGASELWNTYPQLFEGYFPLNKDLVTDEVNKYSLGSHSKAKKFLDWQPSGDLDLQIANTAITIRESNRA